MSKITPPNRPQRPLLWFRGLLNEAGVESRPALVGVRGYFRDSMGAVARNDRGIYDDALAVVSENGVVTFNANTDPSIYREGVAVLQPGVWLYKIGIHGLNKPVSKRYKALVQAAPVLVVRDDKGEDKGWLGINIHRGSYTSTSSLGCQTVHPAQWPAFIALVESEMKRAGATVIPYLLTEKQG